MKSSLDSKNCDSKAGDIIREAYEELDAGRPQDCLKTLENIGSCSDPVSSSIEAVARGLIAQEAGADEEARRHFQVACELGVPLAALLRARGRYHKANGQFDLAFECFELLEATLPGTIAEFWRGLPANELRRYAPAMVLRMRMAHPPRIYPIQPIKAALVQSLGEAGAAVALAAMIWGGRPWRLLRLPLVSLMAHARRHALAFEELIAPRDVVMSPPLVYGGKHELAGIAGRTRSVFVCVLPNVVVSSKSNLLVAEGGVIMDFQGDEITRAEINLDADPIVLHAERNTVSVLDQHESTRQSSLAKGFSLVGIHTWNYGHWIFEFMFQVWLCMNRDGFDSVPLIVDEQMPPQLREALELFVGSDHPVFVLRPGETVRVENLWTCSRISYWPGGARPGTERPLEEQLSDTQALTTLIRSLIPKLERIQEGYKGAKRIFLRRRDGQKRRMTNRVEVERWFVEHGFELLDFDELSFAEQVRRIRAADVIVGQDGASFYGLVFARPGTRIGMFAQPSMDGYEWWCQVYAELGLPFLLYPGTLRELNLDYSYQSDIEIETAGLSGFLEALECMTCNAVPPTASTAPRQLRPIDFSINQTPGSGVEQVSEAVLLADSSCDLQRASDRLANGDYGDALAIIAAAGDCGPAGKAIQLICKAALARRGGQVEDVRSAMDDAYALAVPLASVLRELGRHFRDERSDRARAYESYALLEHLQPNVIYEYWHSVSNTWQLRAAPAFMAWSVNAPRPMFYELQRVKLTLLDGFGECGAALLLAQVLSPEEPWQILRLPLAGLQDYARAHAIEYKELIAPREVHMAPPPIHGRPLLPGFDGRSRSVFLCVLPDIVVSSKSNLLMGKTHFILDSQGDELTRVRLNLDTNPEVLSSDGAALVAVERTGSARLPPLDMALCLTGLHTFNFGHWVFEFMFQVWACREHSGFDGIPLIVDEQMPGQMREMLDFFVGTGHPVVVLKPGQSVHVRRLWTCSKIAFWPGGEKLPPVQIKDYELSDTRALAGLIRRLEPILEAAESPGGPSRIYLTRSAAQTRPLVNRVGVEQLFRDRGYAILDFNEVPFREQVRQIRAARTVVFESGSILYGLLLCRSGTRIGEIADENPAEYVWSAEMFKSLGQAYRLFPCETVSGALDLSGSVATQADLNELEIFLTSLEQSQTPDPVVP